MNTTADQPYHRVDGSSVPHGWQLSNAGLALVALSIPVLGLLATIAVITWGSDAAATAGAAAIASISIGAFTAARAFCPNPHPSSDPNPSTPTVTTPDERQENR